jgi:hypothetical protein
MIDEVLPKMKLLFASLDPDHQNMTCSTCHGPGAEDGSFKMPNPNLMRLLPDNNFEAHRRTSATITQFMTDRVSPDMAKLLGEPPYEPSTQKGFGCGGCHTLAP